MPWLQSIALSLPAWPSAGLTAFVLAPKGMIGFYHSERLLISSQ